MKLHPALIGFISSLLMIASLLGGYYQFITSGETAQLIAYGWYGAGIMATLLLHGANAKGFGGKFSLGFRCFIVVTLALVLFTYLFNTLHPETAQQAAIALRAEMIKANNRTPDEIERDVNLFREGFATMVVSRSIFGYLMFGALVTAMGSFILTLRKP
ncbi:MAG: DUF4199 domain-containing protein [Chitinophagia bacterium]|nr:DUF4199 domain-containing protein [Chitinophagia bacterium]